MDLPFNSGRLLSFDFWPHWDKTGTDNTNYVEPDLFIKFDEFDVIIEAKVKDVTYTDEEGCTIKTTELESYKITIGDAVTATYTITNSKDVTKATSDEGDTVVGIDASSGKIKNTKGVELPSTGGIGTTLFYIIGAILVVGAGILLVTRRRMSAK
jgi:LPXTG-motif cell wall-anchored protein